MDADARVKPPAFLLTALFGMFYQFPCKLKAFDTSLELSADPGRLKDPDTP